MTAIEIHNLSKDYRGKKRQQVRALEGLSLKVASGEVFGFLGPNGSGKSTTIKILMGLIPASAGSALIFDRPVDDGETRRQVGYLPENPSFYDFLTAREYLCMVGRLFRMSTAEIRRKTAEVLDLLDLAGAADRPMRGYSKGMVQRLGIAQTLLHDPALYVLDEPMSGLDPIGRALVKEIMIDLRRRGKTVFFSTHVTADVEAVCDRVGVLVSARLRAEKPVDEIMKKGIQGYQVQLAGPLPVHLQDSVGVSGGSELREVYVSQEDFGSFMARLAATDCRVSLVEPRRKNLEDFFLEIVQQDNS